MKRGWGEVGKCFGWVEEVVVGWVQKVELGWAGEKWEISKKESRQRKKGRTYVPPGWCVPRGCPFVVYIANVKELG